MNLQFCVALSVLFLTTAGLAFAGAWSEPRLLHVEESLPPTEQDQTIVSESEVIDVEKTDVAMINKNPWQPPEFANQTGALGWSPEAFAVPEGMQERVNFWRDIYTKYSTDQGVLHDSQHVSVVYETIDFHSIMNNPKLSDRQKRQARKKLVDDKKRNIREQLVRIEKAKSPTELAGEDLRLWGLFSSIDEPNKYQLAANRKRLRFQLGQSDRFLQGIYYSGRYLRDMEKVFREKGLPVELTRLPFVESSFNVKARSRVGASGIWQFMRYTGRRFMHINYAVDERNDPVRATEAAARLFRMNYEMLKQWPLAVTGYNHGPAGVQRVVRKFSTDNIAELVDERNGRFGFASANFYACFLAALEVEKNAKKYFGDQLFWDSPLEAKEIRLTKTLNRKLLVGWFAGDLEKAQEYNPHLHRGFWLGYTRIGEKEFVRVPAANYDVAVQELSTLSARTIAQVGEEDSARHEIEYYLIGQGETLSEIAAQLGVSVTILKELNAIDNPRAIRAGQKLAIPIKK